MMLKNSPVIKGSRKKDISLLDAESRGQFFWGRPLEQRRRIFLAAKPGPEEIDHVLSCLVSLSTARSETRSSLLSGKNCSINICCCSVTKAGFFPTWVRNICSVISGMDHTTEANTFSNIYWSNPTRYIDSYGACNTWPQYCIKSLP